MRRGDNLGLDHAGRPSDYPAFARAAYAAGHRLDMRYLCRLGVRPINETKIARRTEVDAARAAGLAVGLIWQDGKSDSLRGRDGGLADGAEAARQAGALGYPASCVLFVAVDFRPTAAQLPAIEAYFAAFRETCPWPLGVYGDGPLIDRLLFLGLAVAGWHVSTWGATAHASLRQHGPYVYPGGLQCDPNDVLVDDLAVWNPGGSAMKIVTRAEWGARQPTKRYTMPTPTPRLWLHHAAVEYEGAAAVRECQRFHMDSKGWADIAYSFLVDDDGTVYEGRGAGVVGAHTEGDNSSSHGICAMGNYQGRDPSDTLIRAIAGLVAHGHRLYWWPAAFTGGHRQAPGAQTACPGDRLFRRLDEINRIARELLTGPAPTPTPSPAPPATGDDDMVNTALVPSWAARKGDQYPGTPGEVGMFRLICNDPQAPYDAVVVAYPGVPLAGGLDKVPGWRYGNVFGIPALFMAGLNARPFMLDELADGSVIVLAEDGGTFTVARKP